MGEPGQRYVEIMKELGCDPKLIEIAQRVVDERSAHSPASEPPDRLGEIARDLAGDTGLEHMIRAALERVVRESVRVVGNHLDQTDPGLLPDDALRQYWGLDE